MSLEPVGSIQQKHICKSTESLSLWCVGVLMSLESEQSGEVCCALEGSTTPAVIKPVAKTTMKSLV